MREEGASRDYSMPRSCSGKKVTRSCKMRGNFDNVVIIDVENECFDNVIIIDVAESLQQKLRGSSVLREGKRFPIQGIISIDDDDDDDDDDEESDYAEHPEFNVKNDVGLDSSDIPSKNSPATDYMQKSKDVDADDCQVVQEKRPFKLSKCKKTYTKKSPSRNRYGLNSESESESSESSSSDCEVMEGSSCDLRKQWEKASLKRKSNKRQSGPEVQASPCSSNNNTHPNVRVENRTKQNSEPPVCSSSKNVNVQEVSSNFTTTGDDFIGGAFNPWTEHSFAKSDKKIDQESSSWWWKPKSRENAASHRKADVHSRSEKFMEDCNLCTDECQSVNGHGTRFQNERKSPLGPSPWFVQKAGSKECHETSFFQYSEQRKIGQHSFPSTQLKPNLDSDYERASVQDEDAFLCKGQGEMHGVNHTRGFSMEKDGKLTLSTSSCDPTDAQCKSIGSKEKDRVVSGSSSSAEGMNQSHAPFSDVIPPVQRDIINEREKLKETDQYKRAVEEEWAARQRQLQIQAEEVQRLRKRKKAETLRILDMERRLKQRVEEVRETQRKDEENLNIKENLRAEVRKELCQLENTCIDMASLLRGLGIHVGGGFQPLLQEVHAAYKRALLKFHPDRASRTDIRQQVEAEETFKLISRMKEKFLSTSCH